MSRVSYRMADVLGAFCKEPPESVFKYGEIGKKKWSVRYKTSDIKESEGKDPCFKAFLYTYPFGWHGGYIGVSAVGLKYAVYKKNTAGMEPPVRNLMLAVKHLYRAVVAFRMGENGAGYLNKAVTKIRLLERYLTDCPTNNSFTLFALLGVRHIITGLSMREEAEPESMADYDEEEKAEEAEEITEYCIGVLLGMLTLDAITLKMSASIEGGAR